MSFFKTFPKLLPVLALACLAFPQPAARAAISGSSSSASSIGDLLESTSLTGYTKDDLKLLKSRRKDSADAIKDLKADIKDMEKLLADKDPEATQEKFDKLKKDLTEMEEVRDAIDVLIVQAKADIAAQEAEDKEESENASSGGGSSGGKSGGDDMVNQIKEALLGAALQKIMGGGNNALSQLFGGAQGGIIGGTQVAANPNANFTSGAGDGRTPEQIKKDAEDKKKAEELAKLPLCGSTDTMPGKLEDDTVVKTPPAERDDSGKLVRNNTPAKPALRDDSGKLVKEKPTPTPPLKPTVTACRPPDVDTPNPTSMGDNVGGAASNKISSIEDAKKYVGRYLCDSSNSNCAANGQQCASLTKYFCGVGSASSWQAGGVVKGNNVAVGSCIATANYNGKYGPGNAPGGVSGGSHTGVYLGQNSQGVIMLHQWNGSGGARISVVPWNSWGKTGKEGGNYYYTIKGQNAFNTIPWYLPSFTVSLGNIPADGGLAKL